MHSTELPKEIPDYLAFDGDTGTDFVRKARIIDELPYAMRKTAKAKAAEVIGLSVQYGVKLRITNGMTPEEARVDGRQVLELTGACLALSLFWDR